MAVKIRLKRLGKIRVPQYRVVVVDSRKKRDGRVLEEIGKYHPKEDPSYIEVVSDRAQYWLGVGAQPTEAVEVLLKITGDWQSFKGYKGAEGTLKVAEPKADKLDLFNAALADAHGTSSGEATTKKAAKKTAEPKAEKAEKAEKSDAKADDKAEAKADAKAEKTEEPAAPVPADETPEGAAANAEEAETAAVDAEQQSPDKSDS